MICMAMLITGRMSELRPESPNRRLAIYVITSVLTGTTAARVNAGAGDRGYLRRTLPM